MATGTAKRVPDDQLSKREILQGDLVGGLVAAIVALPLALAFGVQSGLGAEAGLYGAIAGGILAALLGGTRTQVTGPTGPMTVVSATVVSLAVADAGGVDGALGVILLTFFVGGAVQVLFGVLGIAKYVKYFPYPVVSGFMSGVGLIIVVLQIWPFLGLDSPSSTIEVFTRIGDALPNINWSAVAVGAITVAAFYLAPRVVKVIPAALSALVVGTVAALATGWDVPVIGDIPEGLPALQVGEMFSVGGSDVLLIVEYGLVLAVLGSIDSLLTSVIADNITKDKHDSNRELIGQGIGNMAAAVIGGLPGAGATKGTVVNIDAGGRTRRSGAFHGVLLLLATLGAGSLVSSVPLAVLAGILIPIGFAIVDFRGIKHLRHVPRADAIVLVLVLLITVFGDLILAVGIGVVLACVLFMKRAADLSEDRSRVAPSAVAAAAARPAGESMADDLDAEDAAAGASPRVFTKHVYGPLFFGSTSSFQELSAELPETAEVLVIHMVDVPSIDQSGLYALEDVVLDLEQRGVSVLLSEIESQPLDMLRRIEFVPELVAEEQVFEHHDDAVAHARQLVEMPDRTADSVPAASAAPA